MAIQRPLKEGSVRTYQEKVGLGYVDILANEMDGDLDTIYTAWNGGVDSTTLNDGAVTTPKLADGSVTTPKLADAAVTQAKLGPGVTAIPSGPAGGDLAGTYPAPTLKSGVVLDNRARAGVLWDSIARAYVNTYNDFVFLNTALNDVGGIADVANNRFGIIPSMAYFVATFACVLAAPVASGGATLGIQVYDGTSWVQRSTLHLTPGMQWATLSCAYWGGFVRVALWNTSGSTITISTNNSSPLFTCVVQGQSS